MLRIMFASNCLNRRLALEVAGYQMVDSDGGARWVGEDGTFSECPNFLAGEHFDVLKRGLERKGLLTKVQDRFGRSLDLLFSTQAWADVLHTALEFRSSVAWQMDNAEETALSMMSLQRDFQSRAEDRRIVTRALRAVCTGAPEAWDAASLGHAAACRDQAGVFWMVYQTYADAQELQALTGLLPDYGLTGAVASASPYGPLVQVLMVRRALDAGRADDVERSAREEQLDVPFRMQNLSFVAHAPVNLDDGAQHVL